MIESERLGAFTSVLTWDEVSCVVSRVLGRADGVAPAKKLLSFPHPRSIASDDGGLDAVEEVTRTPLERSL
jgi:hypothetical protein